MKLLNYTRFSGRILVATLVVVLVSASPSSAAVVDLTEEGDKGGANGALFRQFDPDSATGTGLISSFLRTQAIGTAKGYNTDGNLEFDTKSGLFTRSLQLGEVPKVTIEGTEYREFLLDINEGGGKNTLLSLDVLKIYVEDACDLSGYPGVFGGAVFDLDAGGDNWIKLDSVWNSGGRGGGMMAFLRSDLSAADETKFVYLYCGFGANHPSGGGFEEWAVGKKGPIVPEPAAMCLLAAGFVALCLRRRR